MALSTTIAELLAKLTVQVKAEPRSAVLEQSVSAPFEYMDRVTIQLHATEPRIDTDVLINETIVTDTDPDIIQSHTVQAGVVSFSVEELLAIECAPEFLIALAEAAHAKLAAQRAALVDPPPPPPAPLSAPQDDRDVRPPPFP